MSFEFRLLLASGSFPPSIVYRLPSTVSRQLPTAYRQLPTALSALPPRFFPPGPCKGGNEDGQFCRRRCWSYNRKGTVPCSSDRGGDFFGLPIVNSNRRREFPWRPKGRSLRRLWGSRQAPGGGGRVQISGGREPWPTPIRPARRDPTPPFRRSCEAFLRGAEGLGTLRAPQDYSNLIRWKTSEFTCFNGTLAGTTRRVTAIGTLVGGRQA